MQGIKLQKAGRVRTRKIFLLFFLIFFPFGASLVRGQHVFIPDEIRISGLRRTKPRIITRELVIRKDLPLLPEDTSKLFEKICQNIFNTRLFNKVSYNVDSIRADSCNNQHGRLNLYVHERWYTFPSPIFELSDRNFNEWWYDRGADLRRVNLGIRFIQKNVRGLNEDLMISFQGGFTQRMEFSYLIPYLDKKQTWGLRFGGSMANNKDVAVRSENNRLVFKRDESSFGRERYGAFISFSKRNSIYLYHSFDGYFSFNRISAFTYSQNQRYFLDSLDYQRHFELRYTFLFDKRDFRYFATQGTFLNGYVGKIGLLPTDNFNIWTIRMVASKYWDLGNNLFFAGKIDGEWSQPSTQPYLGTRVLGFENRFVRGYERYVMEGPINTHNRNSLRWKVCGTQFHLPWIPLRQFQIMPMDIYITGFGDAGYVYNPNVLETNKKRINNLLLGYGIGLNLVTFYDIVLRAEYSWNIHGDRGFYLSFLTDI